MRRRSMIGSARKPDAGAVRSRIALLAAVLALLGAAAGRAEEPAPLALETKIPLGDVYGRIDHMAFDPGRQRLFVAELGNDSVGVVDLKQRTVFKRLKRLREPQGVGYEAKSDTLFVASGVDGTVSLFHGDTLAPGPVIPLGKDADNVRVDTKTGMVVVGYGSGALAVIDPAQRAKVGDIVLRDHPEGFQLDPAGPRSSSTCRTLARSRWSIGAPPSKPRAGRCTTRAPISPWRSIPTACA